MVCFIFKKNFVVYMHEELMYTEYVLKPVSVMSFRHLYQAVTLFPQMNSINTVANLNLTVKATSFSSKVVSI
jgi:hypothetical protein